MTKWSVASALMAVTLLLANVSGQQANSNSQRPRSQPGAYAAGELLVRFSPTLSGSQRDAAVVGRSARRLRRFAALDVDQIQLPPGVSVESALAAFRAMPGVLQVQPNYTRHAIPGPPSDDPLWLDGSLWGLIKIQAQQAWTSYTAGDGSVVIADIDTGVDYSHPDLSANMWRNPFEIPGNGIDDDANGYVDDIYGIDVANHDSDPMDDQGHGTHTAGTVAAVGNNGIGVTGVNWNAKLLACKFLDSTGYGTDAGAIECFNYIVAMKTRGVNIRVSSNSWGEQRGSGAPDTVLQAAIDAAGAVGVVNVFGAGNDGTNNDAAPFDPASYSSESIVSVASSGSSDRRSSFSNYGATSVDLAAPGENILSTYPFGDYQYLSGTSMATPHVAGVAALLAKMDPTLSVPAIKALLLDNVDQSSKWTGKVVSGGRLNAYRAAAAVGSVASNTPPTVAIASPIQGATFKAPVTITVDAVAGDSDGSIQYVSFYANGAPIGTATTSPYSVVWPNVAPGSYVLTAVATDDGWATTTSSAVQIIVLDNEPPIVSITSPSEGATFTSPAHVTIAANASDHDGSVQQVSFFADGVLIGTDAIAPYSVEWDAPMGARTLTAMASDNVGAMTTSAAVHVTINPIPGRINVALASSGGIAAASSILSAKYSPAGAIDGDRKGLNWGNGGGWNDGTQYASPDWIEVSFNGMKLVEEVNVFSMQDSYTSPSDPTPTMPFTLWGLRAFEMQYWDGATWVPLPGGAVTNNNLVWRQAVFVPVTTSKIRVFITQALNGYSRVIEVEAWGISAGGNVPPTVGITSPTEGATLTAPANLTIDAAANDVDGTVQQVEFYAGGVLIGTDATSPFSTTWSGVGAGDYVLTAVATDNQGATTTSTPVHVTVTAANTPPTVSITSPLDGTAFIAPASVTLAADASDGDGSIASVTFYVDGQPLGTDTTSPYSIGWTGVGAGTYTLTAVATDNQGGTATAAAVHVTVNQPAGRMNVALAANGGVATASSILGAGYPPSGAINGDRKGLNWGNGGGWNDGTSNTSPDWIEVAFAGSKTIDEVDVFSMQDSYTAPVEPTPAMTFSLWGLRAFEVQYWNGASWVAVPGGTITNNNLVWRQILFSPVTTSKIRVFITAALNGYSRVIEAEAWGISSGGNTAPQVAITGPGAGATFTEPAAITVTANASDSDGSVTSVAFYASGTLIGTSATAPYGVTWTGVLAGTYQLTAVATDNAGATTTSDPVPVTVGAPNVPPSVSITSPADGATFTAPATLTVSASASDSDGSITSVAFYANGAPIGTATSAPYSVAWSNVSAGSYTLTAVATDNAGSATTSVAVAVTVNPNVNRANLALAINGGVATASSTYSSKYPPSSAIDGDRKGLKWGNGGGWSDGTSYASPDWIEVDFGGVKTLDEVNVFSMQDDYRKPVEPTPTMTFTLWGLRTFEVQYWTGAAWVSVPGASVTNNNLVWRQFLFAPITTSKIRVFITAALYGYSRVIEVEAWGIK